MSVNGTGRDRRTSKPLPDSTNWTVKRPGGAALTDDKGKTLTLNAAEAFGMARSHRSRTGEYVVPVRS